MKLTNTIIASSLVCLALPFAHAQADIIQNGGFETIQGTLPITCTSNTAVFHYSSCQAQGWSGTYQITNGKGGFAVPSSDPNGGNVLVLQTYYTAASSFASQTFYAPVSGEYDLTFYAANRSYGGEQTLWVSIDDSVVASYNTLPSAWTLESVAFYANAGQNTLSFAGLNSATSDATSFVDGVAISAAPEPGIFALLGVGLVGLGLIHRRKVQQ